MSTDPKLPIILTMREVAEALSSPTSTWTTRRARRWLIRNGAAEKLNGTWITTPELLREAFPRVWLEMVFASGRWGDLGGT